MSGNRPLTLAKADPIAAVLSAVVVILGALGIPESLGMSPGDVASVLGGLLAVAAIVRHLMEKRHDADVERIIETAKQIVPAGKALGAVLASQHEDPAVGYLERQDTPVISVTDEDMRAAGLMPSDDPAPPKEELVTRRGFARVGLLALLAGLGLAGLLSLSGCAAMAEAGYRPPGLTDLIARVDVGRVLECARQPTPAAKAKCLGLEALTVGVDLALTEAEKAAEAALIAANPGAGAEVSDEEAEALAADLDAALDELGEEIAAAHMGEQ